MLPDWQLYVYVNRLTVLPVCQQTDSFTCMSTDWQLYVYVARLTVVRVCSQIVSSTCMLPDWQLYVNLIWGCCLRLRGRLTSRISSSLMSRVISFLAFCMAMSLVASMARYSFLSPSFGSLLGGKYVPLTVMPASEYSQIWARASYNINNNRYRNRVSYNINNNCDRDYHNSVHKIPFLKTEQSDWEETDLKLMRCTRKYNLSRCCVRVKLRVFFFKWRMYLQGEVTRIYD